MDITLEKIELVKDRTGVTYAEAKDALEKADGNVVDAIVALEETIDDETSTKKLGAQGEVLLAKIKEIVQRGNVSRIVVSHDETQVLNLPVNVGIFGVVVAPWGILIAALAAFGFKCQIQIVKTDGQIIDVNAAAEGAMDRAQDFAIDAKGKMQEASDRAKDAMQEASDKAKTKMQEASEKVKEKTPDSILEKTEQMKQQAEDAGAKLGEKFGFKKAPDDIDIESLAEEGKDAAAATETIEKEAEAAADAFEQYAQEGEEITSAANRDFGEQHPADIAQETVEAGAKEIAKNQGSEVGDDTVHVTPDEQ